MDFPKKQQQSLIPRYLLQYLQDLQINHNDPTAPWGGGGGGSYTAGDGIEISDENVISINNTVALKTDIPSLTGYATETWVTNQGYLVQSDLTNYVTSTDLATELLDYAELSDLATVATTGSYNDLLNKPNLANYVTTNTEQNITKVKTIYNTSNGHSDIYFKAPLNDNSSNTMGFSAFDYNNSQIGGLQIMNRTLQFNSDASSTYYYGTFLTNFRNDSNSLNTVTGFRVLPSNRYSGSDSINFVAPFGTQSDLYDIYKSNSNVNTVNLVAAVTDGTNTVLANKLGVVNISSLFPIIPTKTSDLTNDSGYITSSALTGYATESWVTNQGYSTFSGSYNDLTNKPNLATVATTGAYSDLSGTPSLATVATTGDYDDLLNKPTIPDAVSGTYSGSNWTSITIGNTTKNIPSGGSAPTNMVTTDTAQDITGVKTFVGEKKLGFKKSLAADVIGFTAYDNNNYEIGNLQIANRTVGGTTYNYVTLGNYSSRNTKSKLGFRVQPNSSSNSFNFVMPYGTQNDFTSNGYYTNSDTTFPFAFTDGTTIVKADATGLVNISSISGGGGGGGTTVSGTNDGTNWTSLTIGSDTYGIPSSGGGGGSSLAPQIYNFTSSDWSGLTTANSYINSSAMTREGLDLTTLSAGQTVKIDCVFVRPSNGTSYVHQFTLVIPDGTMATESTDTFQIPGTNQTNLQIEAFMVIASNKIGLFWSNTSQTRYISKVKVYPANA